MPDINGVKALQLDGIEFDVDNEATFDDTVNEITTITGARGKVGEAEVGVVPFIATKVYLRDGQRPGDLRLRNGDATLRCAGQIIALTGASLVGRLENNAAEGGVSVRFEGRSMTVLEV